MSSGVTKVKVYVLADPDKRIGQNNEEFCHTLAVEKESLAMKHLHVPMAFYDMIKAEKSFLLVNVSVATDSIKLTKKSKIFQCAALPLTEKFIDSMKNPEAISVPEALRSPQKRKISIKGVLRKVSDVIETSRSVRRELYLEPLDGGQESVTVKLWGKKAKTEVPPVNTTMTVKCVNVSSYRGNVELESTVLTEMEEEDEECEIDGEIEGIEFGEESSWIYINDRVLKIPKVILEKVFPGGAFIDSTRVKGHYSRQTVLEMSVVNPAKKTKCE